MVPPGRSRCGWRSPTFSSSLSVFSCRRRRSGRLAFSNSIVSIVPVVAGAVTVVEWMLGHLQLSSFQMIALAALLVAGVSEFLLTIWIRFVVNRRTFAIDTGV